MGIPYDDVERVQWRLDDGPVNTCDFRIVNGVKYVPEKTCKGCRYEFYSHEILCPTCCRDKRDYWKAAKR